ncbi:helix-turn-helix domain-containing protein [Saccharothrix yanglingensis]|uniref:AraC family transcriptional regulator n=1 Tax=Saccharothrix yanglingensis TaxID=659496 RepID=A0ABU0X6V3_9PSEU|nr:AraC family transcriptional regulator [Saccharothrix yanglingensis]MDQ2587448.1 AraC family transcriptional regulator [Saccharothrix yanglingensis]
MYAERPFAGLACVWRRVTTSPGVGLVVPDGCTDVMFSSTGELFVAGPDTVAHATSSSRPHVLHGVRFGPGVGPAAFGVPGDALRDQRVPLAELWGPTARLEDALGEAADPGAVLAAEAVRRLRRSPADPLVDPVVSALGVGGRVTAAGLADDLGLSTRQLHRRCLAAFGYGPKVLHRVLRFDRAVRMARGGVAFAEVAHRTGYADQAHLSREVRGLAGVPLRQLIRS